jgi:hypothetical protein
MTPRHKAISFICWTPSFAEVRKKPQWFSYNETKEGAQALVSAESRDPAGHNPTPVAHPEIVKPYEMP